GHRRLENGDLRCVEQDIETRQRVHELLTRASAHRRDDRYVLRRSLCTYPCDGELRGGYALFCSNARERIDERLVSFGVARREARHVRRNVAFGRGSRARKHPV